MKLSEILRQRFKGIKREKRALERGEQPESWLPTSLREFDKRGGISREGITVFGASTGGGKSLWANQLARASAMAGYTVTVLSMEDPNARVADRHLATETGLNSAALKAALVDDLAVAQLSAALAEMEEWAERVEVIQGVRTGSEALDLLAEYPADLEIFDYFSALPHGRHGREREIGDFCWAWTKHLQDGKRAGVGFAQIHHRVSERGMAAWENSKRFQRPGEDSKKPPNINSFRAYDTGDLMWCTDIGRNAKECWFMFRPGQVLKRLKWAGAKDNIIEFDCPKRNWGAEGPIRVGIDLPTARFYDLPEKETA